MSDQKTAVIIGAGPAGLTAALEFLRRSNIRPLVLEASDEIGGIFRTVRYKGNRMDIGGHRGEDIIRFDTARFTHLVGCFYGDNTIVFDMQFVDAPSELNAAAFFLNQVSPCVN